jgi:hypothetical protein
VEPSAQTSVNTLTIPARIKCTTVSCLVTSLQTIRMVVDLSDVVNVANTMAVDRGGNLRDYKG